MRWLFAVSLIASAVAQNLVATGGVAVAWESATSWSAGVPNGNIGVTIATDAKVTVSSAVGLGSAATLTLGAAAQAGTQLILNNTANGFHVYQLTWNNGWIVVQGNSNFICDFGATLAGGASAQLDRRLIGGTFTLGPLMGSSALFSVSVTGSSLVINGSSLNFQGGKLSISSGAVVNWTAGVVGWVISDVTWNGGGNVSVQGELQNNASITIGTGNLVIGGSNVNTWVWGNFSLTASGTATVQTGSNLIVAAGGRLKRWNANANAMITVAAQAWLTFAAGTTSWIDASITTAAGAVISVDAAATTTVSTASSFAGSGTLNISGTFIANAAVTFTGSQQTTVNSGGTLQINGGVAATLAATTFQAGAAWKLGFATAGSVGTFATITVAGALQLGGQLYVDVPVQPSGTVTLVTATSITGNWSGAVIFTAGGQMGRRLLGSSSSGSVQQTGNTITYTPPSGSSATKSEYIAMIPIIAGLALW